MAERLMDGINVRDFYSRFTRLRKLNGKSECKGLCPLHKEKTPSFFVNLESGSFKCFGCGQGGGPLQFYAALHGVTVAEARRRMREELGLSSANNGSARRAGRKSPGTARQGAAAAAALPEGSSDKDEPAAIAPAQAQAQAQAQEIYDALLEDGRPLTRPALDYFAARRIRPDILDRFGVSFLSQPSHTARRLRKRFKSGPLIASGVFRKPEGGRGRFQFLRHPILFPIRTEGRPVWVQGRRFDESSRIPKYCNLAGVPVPGLFNLDTLQGHDSSQPLFLCEGVPDALVLEQEGLRAVAIVGSSGFKPDWTERLARFRVVLALDNDEAGQRGVERIIEIFAERDLPVSVLKLPQGVGDLNDYFLAHTVSDFRRLLSGLVVHAPDLRRTVGRLLKKTHDPSQSFSYPELCERIYAWFESQGGVFVVDGNQRCFLMYQREMYEIGNNDPFNALMFSKTHLVPVQHQGKMVWQILRSLCFLRGRESRLSWIHTDEEAGAIYVNLHNAANRILSLRAGEVEELANGDNPAGVLLRSADKMTGLDYDSGAHPRRAVELFRELVLEPLACDPDNRLFLGCWILTAFFLDFTSEKALLKLSGHSGSGKTTAARILSCLLYGADHVESATVPYYYADASRNPFLVCDNLETESLQRNVVQFLLHVATGISRGKRKAGTDSETVRETANALVAITAIEPLTRNELISRTYDVEFRSLYKRPGFMQREHLAELVRRRSQILSGIFQLFAYEVLPGLQSRRREVLTRLQILYPRHAKQRIDSFLTLMIVILEALLKMLEPGRGRLWELVESWITYQQRLSEETERDTNMAAYLLDSLGKEMLARGSDFRKEYYLDFSRTVQDGDTRELTFVASSRDLLMALEVLSKNKGFRLPFSNTKQLGVRLANENAVLERAGWTRRREKIVRGTRFHRFTKKLV